MLRPKSSPSPEPARRELTRATRPRWLTGGEQSEGRWDAYIAPSGCPLADLAGPEGLPWRDVRPIFEDLAEELDAACRDGTLPAGLALEQVWVQPDGRAILVDQLGVTTDEAPASPEERAARAERAKDFLYRATALALEGGRHRRDARAIDAAIPEHARAILERLRAPGDACEDLRDVREGLTRSQDRAVEVTRPLRATHLGAQAAAMVLGIALQFGGVAQVLGGFLRDQPVFSPSGKMILLTQDAAKVYGYFAAIAPALAWVLFAFATRGGLTLPLLGLCLKGRGGLPAPRWRCGWRSLVAWAPPATLLVGAVGLQGASWQAGVPSWTLYGLAAALVLAYPILVMIDPSKAPHDRLAGTVVVPK